MRGRLTSAMRLFLLFVLCLSTDLRPLRAQVAAGEITGIVKDQAGAAVPGATVTVTNVATNRQRVVVSSGDGVYTAPSLPPGDYRVDVELSGFKPMRRDGHPAVDGREGARSTSTLAVGDVREQVTVTADAPMLRAETRQPRHGRRARAGRAAAAERPHVHHARRARARRRAAAELAAAAHQRRPAAHQRIPVRRHLGAAAGAGPGGVLPGRSTRSRSSRSRATARRPSSAASTAASST